MAVLVAHGPESLASLVREQENREHRIDISFSDLSREIGPKPDPYRPVTLISEHESKALGAVAAHRFQAHRCARPNRKSSAAVIDDRAELRFSSHERHWTRAVARAESARSRFPSFRYHHLERVRRGLRSRGEAGDQGDAEQPESVHAAHFILRSGVGVVRMAAS